MRRGEIIGHFINIDDGEIQETGNYATPLNSVRETHKRIEEETNRPDEAPNDKPDEKRKYDHLAIYAHGGLNSLDDEARRIERMSPVFKRNRIYNYHLMWGTSAFEELWDALTAAGKKRDERVGSLITDLSDAVFETLSGGIGTMIWSQIKSDAAKSFETTGGGTVGLVPLFKAATGGKRPLKIHLIGHSAGGILLAQLLARIAKMRLNLSSVHLMAPACTVDLFNTNYVPHLGAANGELSIENLFLYNLTEELEQDDVVGLSSLAFYFKSLLYLVSNAYETARKTKLAGMDAFRSDLKKHKRIEIALSGSKYTKSTEHGGFDNDLATMNTILHRILGHPAKEPFKPEELTGY